MAASYLFIGFLIGGITALLFVQLVVPGLIAFQERELRKADAALEAHIKKIKEAEERSDAILKRIDASREERRKRCSSL